MKQRYLEVTYRRGRAFAAYLYLPRREGDSAARTAEAGGGLMVDYAADGRAIGVEITRPAETPIAAINAVLASVGQPPIDDVDLRPLTAAA